MSKLPDTLVLEEFWELYTFDHNRNDYRCVGLASDESEVQAFLSTCNYDRSGRIRNNMVLRIDLYRGSDGKPYHILAYTCT